MDAGGNVRVSTSKGLHSFSFQLIFHLGCEQRPACILFMTIGCHISLMALLILYLLTVWTGMCMGSSTNHVVRFDGLALRLNREGSCTYTLLTVSKGASKGSEVKLHTGPCQLSNNYNQVCMKAIEVNHGPHKLMLKDDMTVRLVLMRQGTCGELPRNIQCVELCR